jgi:hypothetical protein
MRLLSEPNRGLIHPETNDEKCHPAQIPSIRAPSAATCLMNPFLIPPITAGMRITIIAISTGLKLYPIAFFFKSSE